eukprot:CAMPEP_0173172444 /NCGR_PEP_ID=MMETSP1141-20130122/2313_1 /TAXON_ID=483371 /ORGANISM="non described non described, Strain CCMP2298" /LENGTH=82 /DNA_ID=CAMNT_0014094483 /DNA_START=134 /DNA_END=382 /DNA_ORIENTATION=+
MCGEDLGRVEEDRGAVGDAAHSGGAVVGGSEQRLLLSVRVLDTHAAHIVLVHLVGGVYLARRRVEEHNIPPCAARDHRHPPP